MTTVSWNVLGKVNRDGGAGQESNMAVDALVASPIGSTYLRRLASAPQQEFNANLALFESKRETARLTHDATGLDMYGGLANTLLRMREEIYKPEQAKAVAKAEAAVSNPIAEEPKKISLGADNMFTRGLSQTASV